jgi:hypothetical protein
MSPTGNQEFSERCQAVNNSYHAAKVIAFDMLHRAVMQTLTFLRFLRHSGRAIQRSDLPTPIR